MSRKFLLLMSTSIIVLVSISVQGQTAKKKRALAKPAATTEDVQQLKDLVSSQQKQMEAEHQQVEQLRSQLQQLVDATQQANAAAQKAQTTTDQAQSTAAQAQKDAAEAQRLADQASENAVEAKTGLALFKTSEADAVKRLGTLESLTSRFRLTGDIRVRGENYQQSCTACFDRNRARVRARLGLEGKLGEDFIGGLAIATGSLGDPTT